MSKNMGRINRETIRQLASSETVYYRGMRYYAVHAVSNVTWSEHLGQYRAAVQGGSQYLVTVQPQENGEIAYTCNCPAHVKYTGACKHVVAVLLFISDYQRRQEVGEHLEDRDKTAYQIIEYFQKREYRQLTPEYYHLGLRLTVTSLLREQDSKAFISLYAGGQKMYRVPGTKKFIEDYYRGNTIQLGKQFHYVPGECTFEPVSQRVMDYLTEIYEIQETLGKTYYSNLFNRQELVLSKNMLLKLLRLAQGLECQLSLYGRDWRKVEIIEGNPEVAMDIRMEGDSLWISNQGEHRLLSLAEDGSILYYNSRIYLPSQDYTDHLLPFYSAVFAGTQQSVEFRGENKRHFVEQVLPVIKKSMNLSIPDRLRDSYVVEPIESLLYLDVQKTARKPWVAAQIRFRYGKYEINPFQEEITDDVIIVRDRKEEERLIKFLYDLNFQIQGEQLVLKQEEEIFYLLSRQLPLLQEQFTVFYSRDFKGMNLKKPGNFHAGIRLDTDRDLLELNLQYGQIPREELEEFFRSLRLKKKYYRLKKGAFIDLTKEDARLRSLRWLAENGQGTGEGKLLFQKNAALYLEELLPREGQLDRDVQYQELIEDLRHPGRVSWDIPGSVKAALRPYQVVGYQWLKTLAHYGMGGILADDMGLGKTLQSIVYICSEPGKKTLIVCPTSLAYNWQEEFERFAPSVRTCVIQGNPWEREQLIGDRDSYDVWITTYSLIRRDIQLYQKVEYDAMFLDEAQFIKNPASLGARAVKGICAAHRFALTGTPIENGLSELWSVFDFVMPGFLQRYSRFAEQYEKPIMRDKDERKRKELKQRIQPFILRRMKKDVLEELPDKIETKRIAEMTAKQKKIYLSYLSRIQAELKENEDLQTGQGRIQVLAALTRLRQICCHPATFVENYQGGSGKLDLLMEELPDILQSHSVIIFSQFTSMLSIIAQELEKEEIPYFYLSGATKPAERREYVRRFNQGAVRVFLISLKAGGTGLNLTGADTVIHFDPWWNPAVEEQATDRAYRIGQKKKVQVIKMIMKDSIEEKIEELKKRKQQLSDSVIESGEIFVNRLSREELLDLFQAD